MNCSVFPSYQLNIIKRKNDNIFSKEKSNPTVKTFTLFKSQLEFALTSLRGSDYPCFHPRPGLLYLSLLRTGFRVAVLTHTSLRVTNSDSCDASVAASPVSLSAEQGRSQHLAGLSPSQEDVVPSATALHGGAAVGRVTVTETRSLGGEITFNCIRNSCQIKLAEVLQNYTYICLIYLLHIPPKLILGLNEKKKKFIFPLLCYSSRSFVIFGSSSLFDWICEPPSCVNKVINREVELDLAQGNSVADFPAPAHLRCHLQSPTAGWTDPWAAHLCSPIVTLVKIQH